MLISDNNVRIEIMEPGKLKELFIGVIGNSDGIRNLHLIKSPTGVPRLISQLYRLYQADILGVPFLLASTDLNGAGVRQIIAHNQILKKAVKKPVTFVVNHLKAHQLRSLMRQKINFIDTSGNFFIPDALLVFRKLKNEIRENRENPSTWVKVSVIKQILTEELNNYTVSDFAGAFQISNMHASRLVTELNSFGLIKINKEGVSKHIQFLNKPELWKQVMNLIGSPVVKRIYTNSKIKNAKLAGLTALGETTLLEAGLLQTLAIGKKRYRDLQKEIIPTEQEEAKYCLEIWEWEPEHLSAEKQVDPISLYLSLQNQDDDRVQIALQEIIKEAVGV